MSTLLYLILAFSVVCPAKLVALSVCEGGTLNIDCGSDLIHILAANFGRTDGTTCPHSAMSNQACFATNSLSIVTTACEGISICSIDALNSIFGDPCHGTYKYLEVDYECVTPVEPVPEVVEVGCFNSNTDDEPIESLECRDDHLVFHHLERELHVEKCAQAAAARGWTTFSLLDGGACHSDADACQNQDNFGETTDCGATGTSSKHTVYEIIQTELVCEHQTLHLECDCGFIYILSANYGRKDGVTCGGPVQTTDCSATTSYNIVYGACDGEISCDVVAENDVFGDPCVGTVKYLEVEYHCNQISGELHIE